MKKKIYLFTPFEYEAQILVKKLRKHNPDKEYFCEVDTKNIGKKYGYVVYSY